MQIFGPSSIQGTRAIHHTGKAASVQTPSAPSKLDTADQIQFSPEAQRLAAASGEIRADKVASIRMQIQAGQYETSDKLGTAVDRLLDELA